MINSYDKNVRLKRWVLKATAFIFYIKIQVDLLGAQYTV